MIARSISHDARLPLLAHVDELRSRLIVSAVVLAVAFAFAFWQNHGVLNVLNRPLAKATSGALERSHGPLAEAARTQQAARVALNRQRSRLRAAGARRRRGGRQPNGGPSPAAAQADARAVAITPTELSGRQPVTLGIGEPFGQTVTVSAYFALALALPVILFQLYAFVIPAFSPRERRAAMPILALAPLLFVAGVAFGYFVVLPRCGRVPAELQRQFVRCARAGSHLLPIRPVHHAGDRLPVPDTRRRHRAQPDGHSQRASATRTPALCDRRHRRTRPAPAGHRRRDHTARADPDARFCSSSASSLLRCWNAAVSGDDE